MYFLIRNLVTTSKNLLGKSGDFITAPKISKPFSEIIAIWIVSIREKYGKPKKINVIEFGPEMVV